MKRHYEATVNDVVLAIATGALRRWLLGRGVRTEGLQLRALVPVNLREEHERGCWVTGRAAAGGAAGVRREA